MEELGRRYGEALTKLTLHCMEIRTGIRKAIDKKTIVSIPQLIWEDLKRDSYVKKICVDDREINVLFVQNLSEIIREKIRGVLKHSNFCPDYIVDSVIKPLCRDNMRIEQFHNTISNYDKKILETNELFFADELKEVICSYPPTQMQKLFLKSKNSVVFEECSIIGIYTDQELISAVQKLVSSECVLRSGLSSEKESDRICIYDSCGNEKFPIVDMRYVDFGKYTVFLEELYNRKEKILFAAGRLSQIIFVRKTERLTSAYIIAQHAVWDKTSTLLFSERLNNSLKGKKQMLDVRTNFLDYVKEVQKRPQILINKSVDIEEFIKCAEEYATQNCFKELAGYEFVQVELNNDERKMIESNIWNVIFSIAKYVCISNGLHNVEGRIPVLLMQEDRRYMGKDYSYNLGPFLDYLPVLIMNGKNSEKELSILQSVKKKYHINFWEFINVEYKSKYKYISELMSINFHGALGVKFEEVEKHIKRIENAKKSREIYVNLFETKLLIGYPVYKDRVCNIKGLIEKGIRTFDIFK